jgi:hypothetical protein
MLDLLAALALGSVTPASATSAATDSQLAAAPWWERITVTMTGDGMSRGCLYTSSKGETSTDCTMEDAAAASSDGHSSPTAREQLTRITFERRFTPGGLPATESSVQTGDTLLGSEVMALNIDGRGSVKGCKVVAASGDMMLDYGCAEAKAERFQASATRGEGAHREGYMTVLIYSHPEHVA